MTGMYSGLDTEAIIQGLVETRQAKIDTMKKEQTKLEWTQDAWKTLNSKIYAFYNKSLTSMTMAGSYMKKTTSLTDDSVASVITSNASMNAEQKLVVSQVAKTAYMTGEKVSSTSGDDISKSTLVTDLGVEAGSSFDITVGSGSSAKTTSISVDDTTTVEDLISKMKSAGVSASFDTTNQRFYLGASTSGSAGNFTITSSMPKGAEAIESLGLMTNYDDLKAAYENIAKMDDPANATDRLNYINAEVTKQAAAYAEQSDALAATISSQETTKATQISDYNSTYGGTSLDALTDAEVAQVSTDIQALQDIKDGGGTLSEDDEKKLTKLQAQKSAIEEYKSLDDSLTANKAAKTNADQYFTSAGGVITGTPTLEAKVTAEVDAQIADAASKLSSTDWASLEADSAVMIQGQDSEIWLNGAKYTSTSNDYNINGLTITAKKVTEDTNSDGVIDDNDDGVSMTTKDDSSGLYDMIKGFMKEYDTLINEMDKLYNATAAKGLAPLTADEKEAMTEEDVKTYETKIKDALLRRDSSLNTVASAFRTVMDAGYTVNGKTMTLADFGVEKLGYFAAADNERNAYHINGDEDDADVSILDNKLKSMIATDPSTVSDFFQKISKSLYDTSKTLLKRQDGYKSGVTVYGDVKLQNDYNDYAKKIADAEEDLSDYEDKWYDKFTAMETALAKLQSNTSSITSLLGG
jgi:flagellar hook-associated protein 2